MANIVTPGQLDTLINAAAPQAHAECTRQNRMPNPAVTIEELLNDYEPCGTFLRRKDASPAKPSPLFSAADVLRIAVEEHAETLRMLRHYHMYETDTDDTWHEKIKSHLLKHKDLLCPLTSTPTTPSSSAS